MSRRWLDIARKDFQYAKRSNMLLAVVVIFALLTLSIIALPGIIAFAFSEPVESDFVTEVGLFEVTAAAGATIIPITALIAAYLSVAGERQSGRIRLLLSLPPTRRDVVVGKFVARSGLVTLAIVVAYVLGVLASLLVYQTVPVDTALWTVVLTCLMAISFIGIAVGISAGTKSRKQALAIVLFLFIVTVVFWSPLMGAISFLGEVTTESSPDGLLAFLDVLPPSGTYSALYDSLVGAIVGPSTESDAFYRSDPFLVGLLAVWTVGPVLAGYYLFERSDLS